MRVVSSTTDPRQVRNAKGPVIATGPFIVVKRKQRQTTRSTIVSFGPAGTRTTRVRNSLTLFRLTGTLGWFGVAGTLNGFAGGRKARGDLQGATADADGFDATG